MCMKILLTFSPLMKLRSQLSLCHPKVVHPYHGIPVKIPITLHNKLAIKLKTDLHLCQKY